ncbi:MAG TPA: hypothetical protein VNG53_04630 [Bacteroidia bacterium]|nr:hypothetical protein [Bacteroidia bacterium]
MEQIGKRIFIEKSENNLHIEILASTDILKRNLLLGWLLIWTVLGVIMVSQYFALKDPNQKTFVIVYMAFWLYYEYKVGKTLRWRTSGKEVIDIKNGVFTMQKLISGKGKEETFDIKDIGELHLFEGREKGFFKSLNNSYWVIGFGTIAFDYDGSEIKFGLQLEEDEAKQLMKQVKYFLKNQK